MNVEDSDTKSGDDGELERERMRHVHRRIDLFLEESTITQDGYLNGEKHCFITLEQ